MADDEASKRCCICRVIKPLTEFNRLKRAKDGRQPSCRACNRQYHRDNWDRHMEQIRARKKRVVAETRRNLMRYLRSHPCVDCGEPDILVLEFDHVGEKARNVSYLANGGSGWERVLQEIQLCDVVCANCHRRRTHRRQGSYRVTFADED